MKDLPMFDKIGSLALVAAIGIALSAPVYAAPPTEKGNAAMSEKTKKPGETCEKLSKSSDAYKDCISKSAHDGKTPGAKAQGKPKT
jgi:hypothetical protein